MANNDNKNKQQNNDAVKNEGATLSNEQFNSLMDTMSEMKKTIDSQKEAIDSQASELSDLKTKDANPQRRKKRERVKTIKDNERVASFYVLDLELTENNEFVYFDEDRQRLISEKKIARELLITSIERTRNVNKGKNENYLLGLFNCIDENDKKFQIEVPFQAINEIKTVIKGQLYKKYTKEVETNEGVVQKYLRDEDGMIVDEYDIDLLNTTTSYLFDVKIITEGSFKGKKFYKVPASNLNLL